MESEVECPRCKGAGKIPIGLIFHVACSTCKGNRIVSSKTRELYLEAQQEKDKAHGPAA
jgi:DnaJ-class molecular chaperone